MGERFHAFLSHNSEDAEAAHKLTVLLSEQGVKVWLDAGQIKGGAQWLKAIETALADCDACALLIGPSGLGEWQEFEAHLATDRAVKNQLKLIPVLLPGVDTKALPGFLSLFQAIPFSQSIEGDSEALNKLAGAILKPAPPAPSTECPYRGLRYFDIEHARYFFGQEALTRRIVDKVRSLAQTPGGLRFLAIVGCSGSGKSSVARAGLAARILAGGHASVAVFRPGAEPLQNLALALGTLRGGAQTVAQALETIEALRKSEAALDIALRLDGKQQPCLILADQFEECFMLCREEQVRKAFIGNLMQAARAEGGRAIVVICLRADEYGECIQFPELAAGLQQSQALVEPMSSMQLREAIELPAGGAGLMVEHGLADLLCVEVENEPGNLPLLQYTLEELWKRREGSTLTIAAFHSLGQVAGVLESRANAIFNNFTEEQKEICRTVFLRLVQQSDDARYFRRRTHMSELFTKRFGETAVRTVVYALADENARMVIVDRDEAAGGEDVVEIAHEALIRKWSRLRNWLDADKEFQLWRKRLWEAMAAWERLNRDPEALQRGALLTESLGWRAARVDDLNDDELEFVNAGMRLRRRERSIRWATVALACVALVVALLTIQSAYRQSASRRLAGEARRTLEARNPAMAVSLALYAVDRAETREAQEALTEAVQSARGAAIEGHGGAVRAVAFSPDGQFVLTGSDDGTARLWDSKYNQVRTYQHGADVLTVTFTPDGKALATGGIDGLIRLWRTDADDFFATLGPQPNVVTKVAFDQSGRKLISASRDGAVRLWDRQTSQSEVLLSQPEAITAVAVSPNGDLLAIGDVDGNVRVWEFGPRKELFRLERHTGAVNELAFGAGGLLGTASDDGSSQIWNVRTQQRRFTLTRGSEHPAVRGVAFSADGKYVVTAELAGSAYLWNAETGAELLVLRRAGGPTQLTSAAFAPAPLPAVHRHVAIAGTDRAVRIYELDLDALIEEAHKVVAGHEFAPEDCRQHFNSERCSAIPRGFSIFRFWQ
jgi:hypothetical protein